MRASETAHVVLFFFTENFLFASPRARCPYLERVIITAVVPQH